MAQVYQTSQNDTVDLIAWKYYGQVTTDILNLVLQANEGLAGYGPLLPPNIMVTLPDLPPTPNTSPSLSLWN
jgi:phage tail protein X